MKLPAPPVTFTNREAAWLIWNMFPPPKDPPMQRIAKTTTSVRPSGPSPRSASPRVRYGIAPP